MASRTSKAQRTILTISQHLILSPSQYPHLIFIWLLIHPLSYNTLHTLHIRSSYDVLSLLNSIILSSNSLHKIFMWRLISPQSYNIIITLFTIDLHITSYLFSILYHYHPHLPHWIFKWLFIYCLSYNFTYTRHTNS